MKKQEEKIDIYNDRYEHIGTDTKINAHKNGLWHRSFICLVINPEKNTVLLQRKVQDLYNFDRPDYVDFTVGGHYQVGESVEDGIRELQEELGIDASFSDLIPIGIRQTAHTITNTFIENEFQHIFLYPTTQELAEFSLDEFELRGLVEIGVQSGIDLLLKKVENTSAISTTIINGETVKENIILTRNDFIPSYLVKDKIFLRLFIAAKRYIENNKSNEIYI